jgi:hypothetical protein
MKAAVLLLSGVAQNDEVTRETYSAADDDATSTVAV